IETTPCCRVASSASAWCLPSDLLLSATCRQVQIGDGSPRVRSACGGVAQGAADLLGGDYAGEAAVLVDRHQGAEAAQVLVAEQRVEGGVVADLEGRLAAVLEQVGDQRRRARDLRHLVGAVADQQPEEAVGGVDDREPGPAVAQEVLVE